MPTGVIDTEKLLRAQDARKKDRVRSGRLRTLVLRRDSYRCVDCGMSQEEHLRRWKKSLTIDHINNMGRTVKTPDNRLENLQTLCLRYHGRKDGVLQGGMIQMALAL